MRGEDASVTAARVNTQKPHYKSRQNSKLVSNRGASRGERWPAAGDNVDSDSTCGRCGKESTHTRTRGKCPAFGAQCSFCKKMNHWHTVCRKRLAHEVRALQADSQEQADSDSDSIWEDGYASAEGKEYMLSVSKVELPHHRKQDKWVVPLEVGGNGTNVTFRIDTGARCNVMVQDTYRKVADEGSLRKSSKVLYSYSNHRIRPAGVADLTVKYNGVETKAEFEIVDLQQESVISGNLAEQLRLIHRISDVRKSNWHATRHIYDKDRPICERRGTPG